MSCEIAAKTENAVESTAVDNSSSSLTVEQTKNPSNGSNETTILSETVGCSIKRKYDEIDKPTKSDVANYYNAVPETGLVERTQSRIFYLRNFNNWAKSMLIGETLQRIRQQKIKDIVVLDMCCGKGGDLLKWKKGNIRQLVCADIADVSLEQCRTRYMEMIERSKSERRPQDMFECEFINANLTKTRLKDLYSSETLQFDLCSCQFSLHYCFESIEQTQCMLRNACESLKPGGYFIGTILNDNLLVNLARKNTEFSFSNEVCSIKFELDSLKEGDIPLFGAKYHFTLDKVVNLPEYLVHVPLLIELLKQFDMEFVSLKSFPELVAEKAFQGEGKSLLAKMQALEPFPPADDVELIGQDLSEYMHAESVFEDLMSANDPSQRRKIICLGTLSKSEWEVARMYSAFVFRKIIPEPEPAVSGE